MTTCEHPQTASTGQPSVTGASTGGPAGSSGFAGSGGLGRLGGLTPAGPLVVVHAHPDDETLSSGALIATWAAAGQPVVVVTCTRGERGEVIALPGTASAGMEALEGDGPALAAYRSGELARALAAYGPGVRGFFLDQLGSLLPAGEPASDISVRDMPAPAMSMSGEAEPGEAFLGGAALGETALRYEDSGMVWLAPGLAGPDPQVTGGLCAVPVAHAAGPLRDLLLALQPQVLVTYDSGGGYGHPDHVKAHQITVFAYQAYLRALTAQQNRQSQRDRQAGQGQHTPRAQQTDDAQQSTAQDQEPSLQAHAAGAAGPGHRAASDTASASDTRPVETQLWQIVAPAGDFVQARTALAQNTSVQGLAHQWGLTFPAPTDPLPPVARDCLASDLVSVPVWPVLPQVLAAMHAHASQIQHAHAVGCVAVLDAGVAGSAGAPAGLPVTCADTDHGLSRSELGSSELGCDEIDGEERECADVRADEFSGAGVLGFYALSNNVLAPIRGQETYLVTRVIPTDGGGMSLEPHYSIGSAVMSDNPSFDEQADADAEVAEPDSDAEGGQIPVWRQPIGAPQWMQILLGCLVAGLVAVLGTVSHRSFIGPFPAGVVLALAMTLSMAVWVRGMAGYKALIAAAVVWVLCVQVLSMEGAGGDVLLVSMSTPVAWPWLGYLWTYVGVVLFAVAAFLPSRWLRRREW